MLESLFHTLLSLPPKAWLLPGVLAVCWLLETWLPQVRQFATWSARLRHDGFNLTVGALNAVLLPIAWAGVYAYCITAWNTHGWGLLPLLGWNGLGATLFVLLAVDLWMYAWHRANHVVPWLWRWHRFHHADEQLDATSAVRFHTIELMLSALLRLPLILLLGATLFQVALYEALLLPVIWFHHTNVRVPAWLNGGLHWLIVTPDVHQVHHSTLRAERDQNYGSILPWWDILFRTRLIPINGPPHAYGIEENSKIIKKESDHADRSPH